MDLSIVIVNYNTRNILKECLYSIKQNSGNIEYEVIVVENASNDGSAEMVRSEYPGILLIQNVENLGFAKANDQGIRIARGQYILLLNSDTVVLGDSLKPCIDFMSRNPRIGILGCGVFDHFRPMQLTCYRHPNLLTEAIFFTIKILKDFRDPFTDLKWMCYWDHLATKEVDCLAGCFMLVRREVFDKVGLLDERFFLYYEDAEFCWRVRRKSEYKIVYYPDAKIVHMGGMSKNLDSPFKATMAYRSAIQFFELCYGEVQKKAFIFICTAIWTIELLFLSWLRFNPKCKEKTEMIKMLLRVGKIAE